MLNDLRITDEFIARAKKIKLLLMDCDGVLTDGRLYFSEKGESLKVFHVRDGQGIVMWHQAGFLSGIISGRNSDIVSARAAELGMQYIKTGSKDKLKDLEDILQDSGLTTEEIAFIGDDIPDICVMKRVALAITVADSASEVEPYIALKTIANGGYGAVREVTDLLLNYKNQQ